MLGTSSIMNQIVDGTDTDLVRSAMDKVVLDRVIGVFDVGVFPGCSMRFRLAKKIWQHPERYSLHMRLRATKAIYRWQHRCRRRAWKQLNEQVRGERLYRAQWQSIVAIPLMSTGIWRLVSEHGQQGA